MFHLISVPMENIISLKRNSDKLVHVFSRLHTYANLNIVSTHTWILLHQHILLSYTHKNCHTNINNSWHFSSAQNVKIHECFNTCTLYRLMLLSLFHKKWSSSFAGSSICSDPTNTQSNCESDLQTRHSVMHSVKHNHNHLEHVNARMQAAQTPTSKLRLPVYSGGYMYSWGRKTKRIQIPIDLNFIFYFFLFKSVY